MTTEPAPAPRYDGVYYEAMAVTEQQAEKTPTTHSYVTTEQVNQNAYDASLGKQETGRWRVSWTDQSHSSWHLVKNGASLHEYAPDDIADYLNTLEASARARVKEVLALQARIDELTPQRTGHSFRKPGRYRADEPGVDRLASSSSLH